MAKSRIFIYNPSGSNIKGTNQYNFLAVANNFEPISQSVLMDPNFECWEGPDESLGYVIAYVEMSGNRPNAPERILGGNVPCHIGFKRTKTLDTTQFIELASKISGSQQFISADIAKAWLETNGFWTSYGQVPSGMVLYLDAGISTSYPGSGANWFDLSGLDNNGTLSGNVSFSGTNGGTMNFNGQDTFVGLDADSGIPINDEEYTISVWFNSNTLPSNGGLIGWGQYGGASQVNALRLLNYGLVNYWWGNDLSVDLTGTILTQTWYNVVVTYQTGSRSIYLNNQLVNNDSASGHSVPFANNLKIGVTHEPFNEWFDGMISQVIVYKRKITDIEIENLWVSSKSRFGY